MATTNITVADVLRFIRGPHLDPSDRQLIIDALNAQARQSRARAKDGLRAGMKVTFLSTRTGKAVTGTIKKVNRVNVDLVEEGTGLRWRVSPQLLKKA